MNKLLVAAALVLLSSLGGCVDKDLGEEEWFKCSPQFEICPEGYRCDLEIGICVREGSGAGPDASGD